MAAALEDDEASVREPLSEELAIDDGTLRVVATDEDEGGNANT